MTSNAPRAYWLAGEFRKRGKTVVLGGVHPTILPDEALQYADCVVIGEAEGVWKKVLDDHRNGCLQKTYRDPEPDLTKALLKNNITFIIINTTLYFTLKQCAVLLMI